MAVNLTDEFYAAEGKRHGYGSQWLIGSATSPETFEAVAEVVKISYGEFSTAKFERTHLRSPNAHKEYLPGLRDSGPFNMQLNWRPEHESQNNAGGGTGSFTEGGLLAICIGRELRNMKILDGDTDDPDTTEVPFTGFISNYKIGEVGVDGGTDLMVEVTPINGAWHSDLP